MFLDKELDVICLLQGENDMKFLNEPLDLEKFALYIAIPIWIAVIFFAGFQDKGKGKATIFAFCAIGSYFPIFKTIINEATDVGIEINKITNLDAEIIKLVVAIIICVSMTIGWIGCIDAAYQLLFPKKEKQNIRRKTTKKRHKKRC